MRGVGTGGKRLSGVGCCRVEWDAMSWGALKGEPSQAYQHGVHSKSAASEHVE